MRNIKKLLVSVVAIGMLISNPNNIIKANADTTVPYKDVDGVQCVNIVELAKLKGGQVSEASHEVYGNGYNITIDGKLVTIYEEAPYIFIDGKITTLKSEVVSADGEDYNFPVMQTPAKDGSDFLIPMYVIENSLGIKGDKDGIVIETPKEEDTNTGNSNSNNGSNNSGSSNSGGGTTTPKPDPTPTTPPVKPEQPKPETPKPPVEPEQPKPSGMSFSTFASKLPGMGFDDSGVYWENEMKMGVVYATGSEATFSLRRNSPSFNSVIKNCLNMLLPTGGNKVYNIVSSPFSNQTIEVDGRVVTMEQHPEGVGMKIRNK